jgi:hypothetical protein
MNHRDAEITEVVVVISESHVSRLKEVVQTLVAVGVEVYSTDEDEGVVNGSIESYKLPELQKLEFVNYVRSVQTYIADFPLGDARDRDLAEEDDEDTLEAV